MSVDLMIVCGKNLAVLGNKLRLRNGVKEELEFV